MRREIGENKGGGCAQAQVGIQGSESIQPDDSSWQKPSTIRDKIPGRPYYHHSPQGHLVLTSYVSMYEYFVCTSYVLRTKYIHTEGLASGGLDRITTGLKR